MAKYYSRKDTARAIVETSYGMYENTPTEQILSQYPSIDIILCNECKNADTNKCPFKIANCKHTDIDYCSYGKR